MPTFSPPKSEGEPWGDPYSYDPADRLMRYYGAVNTGQTVWKDQSSVWHTQQYPFQGGQEFSTFNDGELVSSSVGAPGLNEALEVYLGGHTYPITDAKATELMAAGFTVGGHLDSVEQKWIDYAIASEVARGWKGGDGCASMKRPDNLSLWVFSDTLVGTVLPNGMYNGVLPVRNSLVVQDSTGAIINQVYAGGGASAAFNHPEFPTKWWWLIDITGNNDGTAVGEDVVLCCWEVTANSSFGHLIQSTLLTLNIFAGVASITNIPTPGNNFYIQSAFRDTTHYYILGLEYDVNRGGYDNYNLSTQTFTRLARAPHNQLTVPASWEYWTGSAWSSSQTQATRLTDRNGNVIEGNLDLTKVGSTYVLGGLSTTSESVTLYSAPSPTGPWKYYHTENAPKPPTAGANPAPGVRYAYYLPKFHEHLNPNPSHLVLSYNRNTFPISPYSIAGSEPIHCSTFSPQFLYLPPPT